MPIGLAKRLKDRAARNHRSHKGELQAILEEAGRTMTVQDMVAFVKRIGLETPSESAQMIREDREDPKR